jgi:hypothetical protein
MPRQGRPPAAARSKKAGRPPEPTAAPARVRRRLRTATTAVRKDTMLLQSAQDPRARWPAARPQYRKG